MGIDAKTSPFAPEKQPDMPEVPGVRFAALRTGARKKNTRPDLLLIALDDGTTVAGAFTRSKTRSAAVEWSVKQATQGTARALVVNSGNANAFTGTRGQKAVEETAAAAAKALDCKASDVFIASTGVIGEPLDTSSFGDHMQILSKELQSTDWLKAARAIMTTDTFEKMSTVETKLDGKAIMIAGIAKGSGMIAPDMATMLAFIFTDAAITAPVLQTLVSQSTASTFNAITVDGDTSTSDTIIAFATGKSGGNDPEPISDPADPRLKDFATAFHTVMHDLALAIVKDGEGITKLIEVIVEGAQSNDAARTIAFSIANSPLVKTAVAGEDANWGRVVMAVGKAGEEANRDKLSIWFGPHQVAREGERDTNYDEGTVSKYMKNDEIVIKAHVGVGNGSAKVWTCDLTHGYISINADYRT